jgi:hypothetical protein
MGTKKLGPERSDVRLVVHLSHGVGSWVVLVVRRRVAQFIRVFAYAFLEEILVSVDYQRRCGHIAAISPLAREETGS